MISRSSLVVSTLALVALGGNAWSQTPPAPDTGAAAPVPPMIPPNAVDLAPPAPPPPGPPSFALEAGPGNTLKVGLLLQPQFQMLGDHTLDGNAYNLYLRRTRVLVGGTLFGTFEYFFETDYPNLFLADNTPANAMTGAAASTVKLTPGLNIQDAFATWRAMGDMLKIDAGYMLPPLAHNAVQGATSLYSWDYFAFTFLSTANTLLGSQASPVGRDLGVQVRGLVFDGRLEYRVGLFQGLRVADTATDVGSSNFFRAAGRLQLNLFDPEPGFFYAGTYLGKKKILSVGISGDTQKSYHYFAGDVFCDLPLGPGVFTGQVDVAHWDGGTFIPYTVDPMTGERRGLPTETAVMGEIGYLIESVHLSPIVRVEYLWSQAPDQGHFGGGLAFWPYGHNSNLKAFYTRNTQSGSLHADNQVNVQWQLFFF